MNPPLPSYRREVGVDSEVVPLVAPALAPCPDALLPRLRPLLRRPTPSRHYDPSTTRRSPPSPQLPHTPSLLLLTLSMARSLVILQSSVTISQPLDAQPAHSKTICEMSRPRLRWMMISRPRWCIASFWYRVVGREVIPPFGLV